MANRRIPDALHLIRGTLRKSRHGDPAEKIQLDAYVGEPPAVLGDEGRKEWFRVVAVMQQSNVITRADRAVLTLYCSLWQEFTSVLEAGGSWDAARYTQLRLCAAEFGFTPASRAKIVVPGKSKHSGFDDL